MNVSHDVRVSEGRAQPLGSTYDGRGTNFSVFSSVADKIEICFFDEKGAERKFALPARTGVVWHGYFDSIGPGQRYGFRVHGPWDPAAGHLCLPEKLLLDPYAKAVDGGVRWHDSLFPCNPNNLTVPPNREDTAPYVPKSVVIDSRFDWGGDRPPKTRIEDTILYEVHVKGFTIERPEIPPELRGTYLGLAHPASMAHLVKLGVTAVELLPIQQFIHRRFLVEQGLRNYWGYDPVCHFAPHNEYATAASGVGAVNEFKRMVKALHSAGLEVIIDVVFINHTGEGGLNGPVLVFRGLDNSAYYRISTDGGLRYADYTGTQNTINTEHPQVRQMIIDSLRYWVHEMHIDGFRFDLAPVLAREGGRFNFEGAFFEAVRRDPLLSAVKLIAEPWDIGDNGYQLGRFPTGWSEWNDKYRDDVRDFWNGRNGAANRLMLRFAGSPDIFRVAGRPPQASINFVTCHDGYTLRDLVTYERKHNEANGEANHDGLDDNHAWNCGVEGPTDDAAINSVRARQQRNFIATLLLSQGVPMLLGGDELGRTQRGNNNAYCQDNPLSWFDWKNVDRRMLEFVSALVSLRKRHPVFRRTEWLTAGNESRQVPGVAWYDESGQEIPEGSAPDSPRMPLQVLLPGGTHSERRAARAAYESDFLILLNPSPGETVFEFPPPLEGARWSVVIDTADAQPGEKSGAIIQGSVALAPHSLAVLSRGE